MKPVQKTVLIVEDERLILDVMVAEFEDCGYRVLAAADDRSALAWLDATAKIDLLFTDIRFPGTLDGWAVARRAAELHDGLAVIYASGFTDALPADKVDGPLFRKPYRPAQVIDTARALLDRAA